MSLSHQFDVKELTDDAATAACLQATVENCLGMHKVLTMYDCAEEHTAMLFIVRRLTEVGQCPDFKDVSVADLERFVRSKEALVNEMDFFKLIRDRLKHNQSHKGTKEIARVFSSVHFERLDSHEIQHVRSEKGTVPEEVLFSSLDRASGTIHALGNNTAWDGALLVPPADDGCSKSSFHYVSNDGYLFESFVSVEREIDISPQFCSLRGRRSAVRCTGRFGVCIPA